MARISDKEMLAAQQARLQAVESSPFELIYDVTNTSKHSKFDLKFTMPDTAFYESTYRSISEEYQALFDVYNTYTTEYDRLANWFLGLEKAIEIDGECELWVGKCKRNPFGGKGWFPVTIAPEGDKVVLVREWYFYYKLGYRPKTSYLVPRCGNVKCVNPLHMLAGDCPKLKPWIGYEHLGTGEFDRSMSRKNTDDEILLMHQLVNGVGLRQADLENIAELKGIGPGRARTVAGYLTKPPYIDFENWEDSLCEYTWEAHIKFINQNLGKIIKTTGWASLNPTPQEYTEEEAENYAYEHEQRQQKSFEGCYHADFLEWYDYPFGDFHCGRFWSKRYQFHWEPGEYQKFLSSPSS